MTTIVLMSGVPTAVWTNTAIVEQIHRSPVLPLHHGEWSLFSEPPSMLGLSWEQSSDSNKNIYTHTEEERGREEHREGSEHFRSSSNRMKRRVFPAGELKPL